jgi:hypothetical protein
MGADEAIHVRRDYDSNQGDAATAVPGGRGGAARAAFPAALSGDVRLWRLLPRRWPHECRGVSITLTGLDPVHRERYAARKRVQRARALYRIVSERDNLPTSKVEDDTGSMSLAAIGRRPGMRDAPIVITKGDIQRKRRGRGRFVWGGGLASQEPSPALSPGGGALGAPLPFGIMFTG